MIILLKNNTNPEQMKLDYKEGLIFIAGSALYHLLDRIWGVFTSLTPALFEGFTIADLLVTVLGIVGVYLVVKRKTKENEKKMPEIIVMESLADKQRDRDEYTRHLREDILGIIESEVTDKRIPRYADSIRKVRTNKKIILQHLFTYEKARSDSAPVYTRYMEICEKDNDFTNSGFKISELKLDLQIDESNIHNSDNDDFIHVEYEVLFEILGFPQNADLSDKSFNLDSVRTVLEHQINETYFHILEEQHDRLHRYHVKHAEKTIAKTNSKKSAEKFLQLLLKYCPKIIKIVHDVKLNKDLNLRVNKPAFDQMFTHIRETITVGKPNFGVCDACIIFFPHGNKMHYRKFLANFNYYPWHWAEEFWGKP